jgi:hypothetical protein
MTNVSTPTRIELAQPSAGRVDVTLVRVRGDREDAAVICVCDLRAGEYFEIPAEPHLALDLYHHPFAYRDISTVDYRDERLAA